MPEANMSNTARNIRTFFVVEMGTWSTWQTSAGLWVLLQGAWTSRVFSDFQHVMEGVLCESPCGYVYKKIRKLAMNFKDNTLVKWCSYSSQLVLDFCTTITTRNHWKSKRIVPRTPFWPTRSVYNAILAEKKRNAFTKLSKIGGWTALCSNRLTGQ